MNCLILTHVFVNENEAYKFDIIKYVLNFYRNNNENLYIIVGGHGLSLPDDIRKLCDFVEWYPNVIVSEIGKGHPILVNNCLKHAKQKGFKVVTKNRLDCIIDIKDFHKHFEQILNEENKKCLITQQTSFDNYMIGDLLMHGDIDFLINLWDNKQWNYATDGLRNLSFNFCRYHNIALDINWRKPLRETFSFRDRETLRWFDIASNWQEVCKREQPFDSNKFIWGYAQGYFQYETEITFYESTK